MRRKCLDGIRCLEGPRTSRLVLDGRGAPSGQRRHRRVPGHLPGAAPLPGKRDLLQRFVADNMTHVTCS